MAVQGFYIWSTTAATNASVDSSVNFAEGQPPSSLNDSNRAVMARLREYGNDMAGAIVTGGAVNAYTVSSYQVFDTLAHLNGQAIAFTPHITNTAAVLLSVDSLGGKPLRPAPNIELQSGSLIQGTPYIALYNNSDGAFYLRGVGPAPGVPLGAILDYAGVAAPSTYFALSFGQALSRTTYATLFALLGTTYGTGDGSTTFNVPDLTGRVIAMKEATATRLTTAGGGIDGGTLGAFGGGQNGTILQTNLPAATLATTITDPGHSHVISEGNSAVTGTAAQVVGSSASALATNASVIQTATTGITASTALGGSGTAFKLVQPTIVLNKILRVI